MTGGLAVIIPVKPFAEGKSRLADLLSVPERAALNREFFDRTLSLSGEFVGYASTIVISRCDDVRHRAIARGATGLREDGLDLNGAIGQAARYTAARGATGILVLPTDLPFATVADLHNLGLREGAPILTIVADHDGTGTNILHHATGAYPTYAFGPDSFAKHCALARAHRQEVAHVRNENLQFDVDSARHYLKWRQSVLSAEGTA